MKLQVGQKKRGCDLSRIGEARVIWRWLGRIASLWELFRIKGSFEGHGCDLSQFGGGGSGIFELTVQGCLPLVILANKKLPEGQVCDLSRFGEAPVSLR